ncbi:hypothetical protein PTKIN_Ptkin03bG0090800 [Pterospermum kingtungense]
MSGLWKDLPVISYVMSAGGLTLKNFKPKLRSKRCFLIFPILGSERKGLVSVLVKKNKGFCLPFMSFHHVSSPEVSSNDKSQNSCWEKRRLTITPQIVHSTLLNCPSNLIALSFFLWCAKQPNYFHDAQAFDCMVNVLTQLTEKYVTLRRIVEELQNVGCVIKPQTFLLLLRIYWRGGLYGMVFQTFEEMGTFGFTPNTFARNVIIDVLFKIGQVDVAIKVLKETWSPNFLTFNIALCNLCKLSDLSNIKDVSRRMFLEGYYPNDKTLEMILNCFCKRGRLAEAYQVLGLMITLGISVSVNVWSILIDGFCQLRQPAMANNLFKRMLRTGCRPNVVIYTTLIKGFLHSQMIASGLAVELDLVVCNALLNYFCKAGYPMHAVELYDYMLDRDFTPDKYSFVGLLGGLCGAKRIDEAVNWTELLLFSVAVISECGPYYKGLEFMSMIVLLLVWIDDSGLLVEINGILTLSASCSFNYLQGMYVRSRLTINPDKVYRMAMRRLNTAAGILEDLIGDEEEYKVGGGLISDLRDPVVKAMAATKEFDDLDQIEDAEGELREAERKHRSLKKVKVAINDC